jgi:hypothetical protein
MPIKLKVWEVVRIAKPNSPGYALAATNHEVDWDGFTTPVPVNKNEYQPRAEHHAWVAVPTNVRTATGVSGVAEEEITGLPTRYHMNGVIPSGT